MGPSPKHALRRLATVPNEHKVKLVAVGLPIISSVSEFLDNDETYHSNAGVWAKFRSERFFIAGCGLFPIVSARPAINAAQLHCRSSAHGRSSHPRDCDAAFRKGFRVFGKLSRWLTNHRWKSSFRRKSRAGIIIWRTKSARRDENPKMSSQAPANS